MLPISRSTICRQMRKMYRMNIRCIWCFYECKIVRIHYRCNSSGPDANLKGQAEIGEAITLVVIMGELPTPAPD